MKETVSKSWELSEIKKSIIMLMGIILVMTSCNGSHFNISGKITGVESDTLLFYMTSMNTFKRFRTDTVALKDGAFRFQVPDSSMYIICIPKPEMGKKAERYAERCTILFFPGNKIRLTGSAGKIEISGSEIYDDLKTFKGMEKIEKEIDSLDDRYMEFYKSGNKEMLEKLRKELHEKYDILEGIQFENIKANTNSMAAGYLAIEISDPETGLKAIESLTDRVKNGPMKKLLENTKKRNENDLARKEASKHIQPGKPAPDFKLKTREGQEVSLATFKGKYLLLDFWGSWCGWCIKGIPDMKESYKKYSGKIEFLGVSCNDPEEKWLKALDKYELPWVNVRDTDTDITIRYAVSGYPTKILIDPDGKIAEIFVGESPALYKALEKMFR